MIIRFGIPILAAVALGFGIATTMILKPEDKMTAAPNPPATTLLGPVTVAGLGELQTPGEPISIGNALSGIVSKVHITTGDTVKAGAPLFAIDDRELKAELNLKQQMLAAAQAKLDRLRAGTRPEDIPPMRARVEAARVAAERTQDSLKRAESVGSAGAMSREELATRRFDLRQAQAELMHAEAELSKLEAGAWAPDVAIAEREVRQAEAEVQRVETQIGRLTVRAPVDATVLRADVREGEFAQSGDLLRPLVVLGRTGAMEVRVQVDEEDASRVLAQAPAEGFLRGRERTRIELKFVRIEPRIVPKTSLTGATTERVDTRVLFVVYEVVGSPQRVYPGQKLDVFIKADAS